jgi:hypothetical protein
MSASGRVLTCWVAISSMRRLSAQIDPRQPNWSVASASASEAPRPSAERPSWARNGSNWWERTGSFGQSKCRRGHLPPHGVAVALDRGCAKKRLFSANVPDSLRVRAANKCSFRASFHTGSTRTGPSRAATTIANALDRATRRKSSSASLPHRLAGRPFANRAISCALPPH